MPHAVCREQEAPSPPAVRSEPLDTDEVLSTELTVSSTYMPWRSWDQVPRDASAVVARGPFFLEIFSGTATLTQAISEGGDPRVATDRHHGLLGGSHSVRCSGC